MYLFPFFSPSRFIFNHQTNGYKRGFKILENKDNFSIKITALGRDLSDVEVNLNGQRLTIEIPASSLIPTGEDIEKTLWQELDLEAKSYTFTLNHQIDSEQIEAKVDQGILLIKLMKKQPENQKIPVTIA